MKTPSELEYRTLRFLEGDHPGFHPGQHRRWAVGVFRFVARASAFRRRGDWLPTPTPRAARVCSGSSACETGNPLEPTPPAWTPG